MLSANDVGWYGPLMLEVSVGTLSPTCIFNLLNISKCHSILGNDVVGAMAQTAPSRRRASDKLTCVFVVFCY